MIDSRKDGRGARPLSPHLGIYRFTPTMVMSILHRITGTALYGGMALFTLWLTVTAFDPLLALWINHHLLSTGVGSVAMFLFTWVLMHHVLGGIRHFIWDLGYGFEGNSPRRLAWATAFGAPVLTVILWIAASI